MLIEMYVCILINMYTCSLFVLNHVNIFENGNAKTKNLSEHAPPWTSYDYPTTRKYTRKLHGKVVNLMNAEMIHVKDSQILFYWKIMLGKLDAMNNVQKNFRICTPDDKQ